MPRFIELLSRFRRDDRGVFAVFFAIIALVLIATSGAVVDFTAIQQVRTRAQTVLDSTALALQPTINTAGVTATTIQAKAQTVLTQQLADSSITATVGVPTINKAEGTLELTATVSKQTAFIRLVGITTLTANVLSQATRKQLDLEVAMVLDNSGSMTTTMSNGNSRMTNLQQSARCATDVLFNGTSDCSTSTKITTADNLAATNTNVRIALVPFTEFVNVGTANKNASWMDVNGTNTVSRTGFDNDDDYQTPFASNVNRFTLYSNIGLSWEGCVEARNHTTGAGGLYYDTSDLEPNSGTPDSLFTPLFAVDQPDDTYTSNGNTYDTYADTYISDRPSQCPVEPIYVQTQVKTKCTTQTGSSTTSSQWNSLNCSGGTTTNTYTQTVGGTTTTSSSTAPSTLLHLAVNSSPTTAYSGVSASGKYTDTRTITYTYATFPSQVLQERLCKYALGNTVRSLSGGPGGRTGPNAECPASTILALTNTKSTIISRIKAMSAGGGTNIHQGVMWGFHALSPTAPLTEGKAYDQATSKVMIVMTDGENTHSYDNDFDGADWATAYNYPLYGRLTGASTSDLQIAMNTRTTDTCANARTTGIVIYTIGLSPPNQTTKDVLTSCAGTTGAAYFPTTANDLLAAFQDIAGKLADLRLAK